MVAGLRAGVCGQFIRDWFAGDKNRKAGLLMGLQEPQAQQLRPSRLVKG